MLCCKPYVWTCLCLYIIVFCVNGQKYKRWTPNTNFDTATNWDSGRVPCSRDRVILPSKSPPIFVQMNATLTELVLPVDGELILGDYVSLATAAAAATSPSEDANCPGTDVQFNHTQPDSWFDVAHWCVTSDVEGDCSVSQPFVLHSEMIPCQYDTAVFPSGHSFLVDLESDVDIHVNALILSAQSYTTGSFRRFVDSQEGRKQFFRGSTGSSTTINIKGVSCTDPSGCACGNDQAPILDRICAKVTCENATCDGPFVPAGSCCATCGAVLDLDYNAHFRISSLKNVIERNYLQKPERQGEFTGVQYIVSKTSLDHIQLVIVDDLDGEKATKLGRSLHEDLQQDIQSDRRYGVSHVTLKVSKSVTAQQPSKQRSGGLGSGSIVGLIVAIFIILLIVFLVLLFVKLRRSHRRFPDIMPRLPSFKSSFRKFNRFTMNNEDQSSVEVGPSVGFRDDALTVGDLSQGFDNPMYAEPGGPPERPVQAEGPYVIDTTDIANGHSNGFTNPLYGEGPVQELVHADLGVASMVKFNPVFTTEGIEDDSEI